MMHHHTIGKCIAWTVVCVAFATFFFYVLDQAFATPISGARSLTVFLSRILLPIIIFSAFLSAAGIQAMMMPNKAWRLIPPAGACLAMFVFFPINVWSGIACVVSVIACIAYGITVQADYQSRIRLQPLYTLASGIGTTVILFVFAISLLAYSTFVKNVNDEITLRNALRDSIVESSLQIVSVQVKGFTPEISLDEFIANAIAGRVKSNLIPGIPELQPQSSADQETIEKLRKSLEAQTGQEVTTEQATSVLQKSQQEQSEGISRIVTEKLDEAERQIIADVRNELLITLGITAKGTDTMRTVLTLLVDRRIIMYVDPYLHFTPLLFTVSLFFVLIIFSFLYKYLTRGFGMVWYGILTYTHFLKREERDVKAQRITLD